MGWGSNNWADVGTHTCISHDVMENRETSVGVMEVLVDENTAGKERLEGEQDE